MANGRKPKQDVMPVDQHTMIDLDRLSPEEREMVTKAYVAGAGAAAAIQAQQELENVNVKEFYGHSPTDLRREFTTLPKPAHGAGRRSGTRITTPGVTRGNTGSGARQQR